MEIYFVIVNPAVPENVGAIARAINTMGFSKLRLVNPCNHLDDKAMWLAHGSHDILKNAEVFSDINTALQDMDFIVGTTAKKRRVKEDYLSVTELKSVLSHKKIKKLAMLFGREESGLSNKEMEKCHLVSSIPLKKPYPSLNLAQAVMLYAYELSALKKTVVKEKKLPDRGKIDVLNQNIYLILESTGLSKNRNLSQRIIERINLLGDDDAGLMLSVCLRVLDGFEKK
ncbi:MAG: tRNA/rRNA methyltransferase [Bacteroidales bacterium]|nr:tRNA/rRNA methyltransferase [Bacteroidales bacterium]